MPENKVQIVVEVDAKTGQAVIRQLGQEMDNAGHKGAAGFGRASAGADRLRQSMAPVVGLATQLVGGLTAVGALMIAKDAALAAARYETLGVAMKVVGNNAGYTGAEMAGFAAALQQNGIAMTESRETLTRMAQAHIDLTKASQLARIAQDAAVIGNINSSEAFERMIHGVQSGQIEVLRTIGINVNFENSYKKLAAQLGKTSEELTETEKMTARVNVVMEAGAGIAGTYEAAMTTAGKQLLSVQRYIDNLGVTAGSVFNDVLIVGVAGFTAGLKEANSEASALAANGTLAAWGKGLIYTFAILADTVAIQFKTIASGVNYIMAAGFAVVKFSEMYGNAAARNFAAAKRNWQELKGIGATLVETEQERWKNAGGDFTTSASQMYASRVANAEKDAAAAAAAEKKRMAAGAAARAQAEADERAAGALKKQQGEAKKAAAQAASLAKEWEKVKLELTDETGAVALTGLDHALAEIDKKADQLRRKFGNRPEIDEWQAAAENAKIQAKVQEDLTKATEDYREVALASLSEQDRAVAKVVSEYDHYRQVVVDWGAAAIAAGKDQATTMDEVYNRLDALDRAQGEEVQHAKDQAGELTEFQKQAYRNMESAGADFFHSLRTDSDDWLDNWVDMLGRMVDEWASAQMMMGLFGQDFGKGGALGGVVGGLVNDWNTAGTWLGDLHIAAVAHSGWNVGTESAPAYRAVSPSLFANAPRFHNGLAPDEFPAILQEGERVWSVDQVRQAKTAASSSTSTTPAASPGPINVTIIAADAQSITEMMRRNPQAVLGPLREALRGGDRGLRADLQRVM